MIVGKPLTYKSGNHRVQVATNDDQSLTIQVNNSSFKIKDILIGESVSDRNHIYGYERAVINGDECIVYTIKDSVIIFNKTANTLTQEADNYTATISYDQDGEISSVAMQNCES